HDHRLPKGLLHRLAEEARHDVDAAARRVADQDADWPVGPVLRARCLRSSEKRNGRSGKLASVEHDIFPGDGVFDPVSAIITTSRAPRAKVYCTARCLV